MMDVMGNEQDMEQYNYFQRLVARAFLAARQHASAITSLVHAMADSGLDCYEFDYTLERVRHRCGGAGARSACV